MGSVCGVPDKNEGLVQTTVIYEYKYKNVMFQDVAGDISNENVDVIINPANNQLLHKTGVASNLVNKGGELIQEECKKYLEENNQEFLPVGTVVTTSGGNLACKHIVHVVTPIWTGGDQDEVAKLSKAVMAALSKANTLEAISVAFPTLSGGIFGFPRDKAAEVLIKKAIEFIDANELNTTIRAIRFVNINNLAILKKELEKAGKEENIEMMPRPKEIHFEDSAHSHSNEILKSASPQATEASEQHAHS